MPLLIQIVRDANSEGDPSFKAANTEILIDGTGFTAAALSGDVTMTNAGVVTIANDAVQAAMLNDDIISGQTEMTGDVADADELLISDAGTIKRADFSVVRDAVFNDVSGDATIAAGGALTIANGAVETAMIADESVTLAKLAHAAANTVLVRDANSEGDPSFKAVANTEILIGDGTGFTAAALSGDVTMTAGVVTKANDAVQAAMLNDDIISGQTEMTGDVADADELLISDAGTVKRADFSVVRDAVFNDVSGDATIAAGGALTGNGAVETAMIADESVTLAKLAHTAANTVLVRDANSAGDPSFKAVANTEILIGDGTGFTAAALSGDVTMTNRWCCYYTSQVEGSMLNNNVILGQTEMMI